MRILALTFADEQAASSYYRVYQYQKLLTVQGHTLDILPAREAASFDVADQYDVVFLQKLLLYKSSWHKLRRRARRVVYDLDDAIWTRPERPYRWWVSWKLRSRARRIAQESDLCLTSNEVLADALRTFGGKAQRLPMALNLQQWPDVSKPESDQVVIGWAGAPGNLRFLHLLAPALGRVLQRFPQTRLEVFSGKKPELDLPFTHLPYAAGQEATLMRRFDIGLLPLPDNEFTRAKSPIKALQYFGCRAAVVASPVGATCETVMHGETGLWASTDAEWEAQLVRLIESTELRRMLAEKGRRHLEAYHDLHRLAGTLAGALQGGNR